MLRKKLTFHKETLIWCDYRLAIDNYRLYIILIVENYFKHFLLYVLPLKISKSLEQALVPAGRKFTYENTSAAMELLDISIISEQLNSLLIDYMVNNDVYLMDQSQTTLGVLD